MKWSEDGTVIRVNGTDSVPIALELIMTKTIGVVNSCTLSSESFTKLKNV